MALGVEVGLGPGHIVVDGDPALLPKRGRAPFIFRPISIVAKRLDASNATWYGGRPQPRRLCVRWGPSSPKKGHSLPHPIFGSCLLWPNGCTYHDTTWYVTRPQPRRHCIRWGPSSPSPNVAQPPPQFSANVRRGQMAEWTKMSLGMEVGLGPGDFVFDGDPAPPKKGTASPTQFSAHVYCG